MNVKKQKKNAIQNQRNVIADLLGDYSLLIFVRNRLNQAYSIIFFNNLNFLCFNLEKDLGVNW